jgi:hypothetical protein
MTNVETLESHMIRMEIPYEQVGDGTWVLYPDDASNAQVAVKVEDPIVLFSIQLFDLDQATRDREGLFRRLLELNSELLHASYALEGNDVVLAGALQLEEMDFTEFQAMIDDMSMALDNHYEKLAPWVAPRKQGDQIAGGDA